MTLLRSTLLWMNITTELSAWWMVPFFLFAAAAAWWLYFRQPLLQQEGKWLLPLLRILRFASLFLLLLLLLSPLLQTEQTEVQKPIVVVAQDNSASLVQGKQGSYYKKEYLEQLRELKDKLSKRYELAFYTLGEGVHAKGEVTFKEKETELSGLVDELRDVYANRNVGAVVLATDGLINRGQAIRPDDFDGDYPVYAIAMGDTTPQKDLAIQTIHHNRLAYLGNRFPVEFSIQANRFAGASGRVEIREEGRVLYAAPFRIGGNDQLLRFSLELDAAQKGVHAYEVVVPPLPGESTNANNRQTFYVEVLDGREKILLAYAAPHPDVAAIRRALEANANYEVQVIGPQSPVPNLSAFSVLVAYQIPAAAAPFQNLMRLAAQQNLPTWFMLGTASNLTLFNQAQSGMQFSGDVTRPGDAQGAFNAAFSSFHVPEALVQQLPSFPPLKVPFGTIRSGTALNNLLVQQVGSVRTSEPLLCMGDVGGRKCAYLLGEGLWRWPLTEYQETEKTEGFHTLVSKVIQYLSAHDDKKRFKVIAKPNYRENEAIEVDAELYNNNFELINDQPINLEVTNEKGKRFTFGFTPTRQAYRLQMPSLAPGRYTYSSSARAGDQTLKESGAFTVSEVLVELSNTTANHQALYAVAARTGGKVLPPEKLSEVLRLLEERSDVKPISRYTRELRDAIHLSWLFAIVLVLLALEWFLRKRFGSS
jgi:hypothetical protein